MSTLPYSALPRNLLEHAVVQRDNEINRLRAALAQAEARVKVLVEECSRVRQAEADENPHPYCESLSCSCSYCAQEAGKRAWVREARAATDAAGALTRGGEG